MSLSVLEKGIFEFMFTKNLRQSIIERRCFLIENCLLKSRYLETAYKYFCQFQVTPNRRRHVFKARSPLI